MFQAIFKMSMLQSDNKMDEVLRTSAMLRQTTFKEVWMVVTV